MEGFLAFLQALAAFVTGPAAVYVSTIGLALCFMGVILLGRHVIDNLVWVVVGCVGLLTVHTVVNMFGFGI